ncbi:MAG: hypothetical protein AVDCRST_MAG87-3367, partial [uncultured Thermomicrobiales bacterium]
WLPPHVRRMHGRRSGPMSGRASL